MASSFGPVGSVLTERPPADGHWATPPHRGNGGPPARPQTTTTRPAPAPAPPQRHAPAPHDTPPPPPRSQPPAPPAPGNRAWYDSLLSGRQYEVVYDDAQGYPLLAFADGQWYDVTSFSPQPVTVRYAVRLDPAWAGAVVQTVCMWMRSNPNHDRSFELATEMALTVGELARLASS